MTVQWTEIPKIDEELFPDCPPDNNHIQCDCGVHVTFCGTYSVFDGYMDEATQDNSCPDCWKIYEQGYTCARCTTWYKPYWRCGGE